MSEAKWTYFVETLRSGDDLLQKEAYDGIKLGLESNRPVPTFIAELISWKLDYVARMKDSCIEAQ